MNSVTKSCRSFKYRSAYLGNKLTLTSRNLLQVDCLVLQNEMFGAFRPTSVNLGGLLW